MRVVGPDWESTSRLADALSGVPGSTLAWGTNSLNGLDQLARFTAAGVLCPDWTEDMADASAEVKAGNMVLGRSLRHTQGKDISLPTMRGWAQSEFYVKYIPSLVEYRQHVWDGKCIRVGQKVFTGLEDNDTRKHLISDAGLWRGVFVRSRRNGWTIDYGARVEAKPVRKLVRATATAAVSALGYPGGAVDMVIRQADGAVVVLEVNKAPSLRDDNTLAAYVRAITLASTGKGE